jgi:hypothetical protein
MRDALSTVDTAIHGVQTAANNALANIASDNILSPGEKPAVVLDYTNITNEQSGIDAQAGAFTCTTVDAAKGSYDTAVSNLTTYLGTLTGWNVIPGSDVAIVGTTFRQKFADVYSTRQALLNAIYARAKALADAAQVTGNSKAKVFYQSTTPTASAAGDIWVDTGNNYRVSTWTGTAWQLCQDSAAAAASAKAANDALTNIASDNILSPGEKPAVVLDYTNITNEQSGIDAQAGAFTCTTVDAAKGSYDTAVSNLATYLGTLTGWNVIPGSDVAIVGTTFRQKFADVYSTRQALLNAIYARAKALADAAQSGVNTINDPDTLTVGEKPQIILDYNAITGENADLVAKANAYSVDHSTYDTAYSALVTTYLPTLTSPTAWNSLSGTTSLGTGNRVALWNPKWAAVKNAAADLRNAIAVGTGQKAISTAATDALNKANAAQLASQPHQVAWAYASRPALPNALYPAGYYAITTDARTVQVNAAGTAWTDVLVAATGVFGQFFTKQLVVMNFDNLIPNPNSELDLTNMPVGSYEGAGVVTATDYGFSARSGTKARLVQSSQVPLWLTDFIPCGVGDQFYFEGYAFPLDVAGQRIDLFVVFFGTDKVTELAYPMGSTYAPGNVWSKVSVASTPAPSGTLYVRFAAQTYSTTTRYLIDDLYARRMADASMIVDGTLQALVVKTPLLYSLDIRSGSDASGYTAGTAIHAPIGFRISAIPFNTTYIGGTTDSTCQMELGGSVNIGGYKAQTYADRVFQTFNRVGNGLLAYGMAPWGSTAPPTYGVGRTAGLGSLGAASPSEGGTYTLSVYQSLSLPKLYPGQVVNLDLYTGFNALGSLTKSGYIKAYLLDSSGTETLLNTWTYSTTSTQSMTWTQRITNISSNVSAGGDYVIRFEISATGTSTGGGAVAICEIKVIA